MLFVHREKEVVESSESSDEEDEVKPSTPVGSRNVKHDLMMRSEVSDLCVMICFLCSVNYFVTFVKTVITCWHFLLFIIGCSVL